MAQKKSSVKASKPTTKSNAKATEVSSSPAKTELAPIPVAEAPASKEQEKPTEDPNQDETNTHEKVQQTIGTRKGGKIWKETKKPLRMKSVGVRQKSWDKKMQERLALQGFKEKAKELKEEKDQEKKRVIEARKAHLAAKEEKERYELLAKKMHAKKVERLRRREKRNKLLKER